MSIVISTVCIVIYIIIYSAEEFGLHVHNHTYFNIYNDFVNTFYLALLIAFDLLWID